ncbi:putative hydrolase or acyltransferase of alpha/beta superfamily [Thioflavicoccus mobilis 8321]|uniref:Putative hydrolase or acyltransferase of alpha/beta superfamily n=1 Tax=Thioflavicoccus mobilis 8321 TaxID=765912 RepID=L0GW61_9GAMM|nr:alpha/beta hydrolase [Thioflavicoccus mobilis]AGA90231.1 putative hydrolase or acyltransferase of alpha/beta superfamily [Thioflavicoccus mobilis 8321]
MSEVEARGIRFHVRRLGSGKRTVVFVHGMIMDDLSSWYFTFANEIAKLAQVVLYDLRGHGKSERPAQGYRVDDMVDDLGALLDALGLSEEPVDLVGNSYGGLVALAFAVQQPERVRSLVLLEAHVAGEGWAERMQRSLSLEGEERDRMIADSFKDWAGRHSKVRSTRLANKAQTLIEGTSLLRDLQDSRVYSEADLVRVTCPTLAIYGENSDILFQGELLARTLPSCRLEVLAGSTHSVLWEQTAAVRKRLVDWFSSPDGSSREAESEAKVTR